MKIIGILCEEGLTSRSQGYNLYTKVSSMQAKFIESFATQRRIVTISLQLLFFPQSFMTK